MLRNIKNVAHDLLPVVKDLKDLVMLHAADVSSMNDLVTHLDEIQQDVFLIEQYLTHLNQDADAHGIAKAKTN